MSNYSDMVANLKKPGGQLHSEWGYNKVSACHMLIGMFDEWLEVQEAHEGGASREDLLNEVGDMYFYLEGLEQDLDTSGEEVYGDISRYNPLLWLVGHVKKHLVYGRGLDKGLVHTLCHEVREKLRSLGGFTDEEIIEANMKKLTKRYSAGAYSDQQAIERRDQE